MFKYFAFISYNSKDTEWGQRLQRKLENYRMSATLCSEHGWKRRPIKPVFFAPTDILPGGLSEELQQRLISSRHLIVICSPNSAQSEWVGKEIEFFHQLGRTRQIHFFIVDGVPNSGNRETECFNPIVNTLGLPEILGANVNEKIYRFSWLNRERAYVQLISKLLGVEFDTIWQRHKRLLVQKMVAWTVGIMLVLAALVGVWMNSQPIDVAMDLQEANVHNRHLPTLSDAVVTMTLDNETKTDTLHDLSQPLVFTNIPHRYVGKMVRIRIECFSCVPVDTTVELSKRMTLPIRRNTAFYGHVRLRLWDGEKSLPNVPVRLAGREVTSDADGIVELDIPLEEQATAYPVTAAVPLELDSVTVPCGPDDCLNTK